MSDAFEPPPVTLTGRLRDDLIALVVGAEALMDSQPFPRLMAAVIDAGERDRALASLHGDLTNRRREPFLRVLGEAAGRGEVAADVDPELAADLIAGPLFYRRFVSDRPLTGDYGEALIDRVIGTLAHPTAGMDCGGAPLRDP